MERRASARKPIKLAATLMLGEDADEFSCPCQIADFCPEGIFVRFSSQSSQQIERRLQGRYNHQVLVTFREADGRNRHQLHARVARRIEGAMGLAFTQVKASAVGAMLRLCMAPGALEPSQLKHGGEQAQFIFQQCARQITRFVEPLMTQCFDVLEAALQQAAGMAASDQQANDFLDAAAQIRSRRRTLWLQMAQVLESPLKAQFGKPGRPTGELALIDKDEFEDWLTIKVMVTKAETQYRSELLQLRMRLDKLGVSNQTGQVNPLGPALLCDAFVRVVSALRSSRAADTLCLRKFEQQVLKQLAPLYVELNLVLVRHGILPDLDLSKYLVPHPPLDQSKADEKLVTATSANDPLLSEQEAKSLQKVLQAAQRKQDQAQQAGQSSAFTAHQQVANSAFATVKQLLSTLSAQGLPGAPPPPGFAADAEPLTAPELHRQLQDLQRVDATTETLPEESLRARVVAQVHAGDRALAENEMASLDVVDRFFSGILSNPRLNDQAKMHIRRLEVPVFKVVLGDSRFFDDQGSPVRAVINRLARLGLRGARVSPVVTRRIDSLLQRVNNEFEQDTGVFSDVVTELDALIERQNEVYRKNVERVAAAAEGMSKVEEAKRAVTQALEDRLRGRAVPNAVMSLLNGGWRDLLALTWIRQGETSTQWLECLSVIDTLLLHGEDPAAQTNLPELLRVIQEGLAAMSSNHMPAAQLRDELRRFLLAPAGSAFESVLVPVTVPATPQTPAVSNATEDKATAEQRRRLQRWEARARKLKLGEWMRYQQDIANPLPMRLVWVATNFSRYVFVNHQGMKVVEMDSQQLARELQQGILVPDSQFDMPIVDESIDRMIRQVYEQLSWASTHDAMTGLQVRREFERVLDRLLDQQGADTDWVLAYVDLRHFRLLNDSAGFHVGDQALRQVAGLLRQQVSDETHLARVGGNEFACLLRRDDAEANAFVLVHQIESMPLTTGDRSYEVSAVIGLASLDADRLSAERWLKAAAAACQDAKRHAPAHGHVQAHGRVNWYQGTPDEDSKQAAIVERIAALSSGQSSSGQSSSGQSSSGQSSSGQSSSGQSLGGQSAAADQGRILLRCQKIIPLHQKTRARSQYEVLISTYDDKGDLVSASEFVRMAERYNRMGAVDRWVVGHMLDWLRAEPARAERMGGVCINLSGYALNEEELLEYIYQQLSTGAAPLERLCFEITEAAAISNLDAVAHFIHEVKELGCRFCLGNFGSGQASYQFLKRLPVDMIKIDGAFIRELVRSEADRAMVRSMTEMAHFLGREVIASQVEDKALIDILASLGVDYAQGFGIERPRLLSSLES